MSSDGAGYSVEVVEGEGHAVVRLTGELDLRAAPELRGALTSLIGSSPEASASGVVLFVEMSGLTFLDSTIISVFLMATKAAAAKGSAVALVAVPAHVERVLEIAGVSDVLVSFPSLDAALESLSS